MDNASKALLMVGGVMIAIAVISVSLYIYSSAKGYASGAEDIMTVNQITSFNRFYTAYESPIRVIDAVNILNRAVEDDVDVVENVSFINKSNGVYVSDSSNYLTTGITYSITKDSSGKVSKIKVSN